MPLSTAVLLDAFFHLTERRSTVASEARAGTATFLTMAYILLVNPPSRRPASPPNVAVATALSAALATLLMGLWVNYPFALAAGIALFPAPIFTAIPAFATASALIAVGALMMQGVGDLDWSRLDTAIPAFLTIVAMPFTYSIANGITLGIVSYVLVQALAGRACAVHPILYGLTVLLLLYYAFAGT